MTTVETDGVTLGLEHFGDAAAPLVLLVGGTTMLSWPDAFCAALARGGRQSCDTTCATPAGRPPSIPRLPHTRCEILQRTPRRSSASLDDRPAHLAGIGVGGIVAQVAALDHPDAFSALTLAGSRPVAPGPVDDDLPDHDAATMDRLFSRAVPDRSDRAAVAQFAAGGAEILGDDPAAARATAERIWDRTPGTEPAVQMANQMGMVFSSSTASHAGASACPSLRSWRWSCTVAATRSSLSVTARRSRARSPVLGCSCSNGPRRRSPMRPPMRSHRRCSRSSEPGTPQSTRSSCRPARAPGQRRVPQPVSRSGILGHLTPIHEAGRALASRASRSSGPGGREERLRGGAIVPPPGASTEASLSDGR